MTNDQRRNRWSKHPDAKGTAKEHKLDTGRRFRLDGHLPCRHCGKYQTKDGRKA